MFSWIFGSTETPSTNLVTNPTDINLESETNLPINHLTEQPNMNYTMVTHNYQIPLSHVISRHKQKPNMYQILILSDRFLGFRTNPTHSLKISFQHQDSNQTFNINDYAIICRNNNSCGGGNQLYKGIYSSEQNILPLSSDCPYVLFNKIKHQTLDIIFDVTYEHYLLRNQITIIIEHTVVEFKSSDNSQNEVTQSVNWGVDNELRILNGLCGVCQVDSLMDYELKTNHKSKFGIETLLPLNPKLNCFQLKSSYSNIDWVLGLMCHDNYDMVYYTSQTCMDFNYLHMDDENYVVEFGLNNDTDTFNQLQISQQSDSQLNIVDIRLSVQTSQYANKLYLPMSWNSYLTLDQTQIIHKIQLASGMHLNNLYANFTGQIVKLELVLDKYSDLPNLMDISGRDFKGLTLTSNNNYFQCGYRGFIAKTCQLLIHENDIHKEVFCLKALDCL